MTASYRAFYLLFTALIVFAVWMLAYGIGFRLFYGDGRLLELTLTSNPFAPIQQFWLYFYSPIAQRLAIGSMIPALLIGGLVAFIGLRPAGNPLGDAAFQDVALLRWGKWFRKDGHIMGRYGRNILRVKDDRHHLIIGPTRSGKGAGYVIPNALMHEGSMIVTDLKGEVYKATAGYRKRQGNQVFLFSPGAEHTSSYNPLDFIRPERGNRTTDIQNIAAILVPENTQSDNSIWQATAQQAMAGVISYIHESVWYEGRRNLGEVNSFFNSGSNVQALMTSIKENEPYLSKFTVESFNAYIGLSDRAAQSALLDIQNALRPFKNERIVAATNVTDMDLSAMTRRPITIYLAPNITDLTLLRPLLTLFVQQVMDLLTRDHNPGALPVYFLLDEFRQLKRMDEIMTKLPYVAGYNIKMAFIIQDLKNIDEIYGETSRHSLLGNCGYQLVLGANDLATAEYVSQSLGKRTIRYKSESRTIELVGLPRRTKVEQIRERDLMMPQEVRQMPADRLVILVEGQRPIFATKLEFFKTEPFKGAHDYAQSHMPAVPTVEYIPPKPIPALTEAYRAQNAQENADAERSGSVPEDAAERGESAEQPSQTGKEPEAASSNPPAIDEASKGQDTTAVLAQPAKVGAAGDQDEVNDNRQPAEQRLGEASVGDRGEGNDGRIANVAAFARIRSVKKATDDSTAGPGRIPGTAADEEREDGHLKDAVYNLRDTILEKPELMNSPRKRRSTAELFDETVPDPLEDGFDPKDIELEPAQ